MDACGFCTCSGIFRCSEFFNISAGAAASASLNGLINMLENMTGRSLEVHHLPS